MNFRIFKIKKLYKILKMREKILFIIIAVFLIAGVNALDFDNQERLNFGHILVVSELGTEPSTIEPGVPAEFSAMISNEGNEFVNDARVELKLPAEIGFFNDISQKNIFRLNSEESRKVKFNLIALPGISEGIYIANLSMNYVNHIGEEKSDEYTMNIIVKSKPKMFVQIEDSEIYKGKNIGEITVKFVNNNVADIKFLTVELMDSEEYSILSAKKVYVGDLDSDDFESVNYRIKTKKKSGEVYIPLKITYKDKMNNPISDEVGAVLTLHSGKDLGKVTSNTTTYVIVGLIILGAGYWFYRRWKKKKKREKY